MGNKGFSLIELLVVFAIIGAIISLAIIGLVSAQSSSRDTARKTIAATINEKFVEYITANGKPTSTTFYSAGGFIDSSNAANCATGTLDVNNTCVSLQGLQFDTAVAGSVGMQHLCSIKTGDATSQNIKLCYVNSFGSNGYRLGVYLEAQTYAYMLAQ